MGLRLSQKITCVCFENDLDAFVPEVWAQEALMLLEENMVVANLVKRNFENQIQEKGDTVNTRQWSNFTAYDKGANDDVTVQDAVVTNIPVVLNRHIHATTLLRDSQLSLSFQDLKQECLRPLAIALARKLDKILLSQVYQFLGNSVGTIDDLDSTTAKGLILDTRNKLNVNLCPEEGRNLILTPNSETECLKLDLFVSADKLGDAGTAMRTASLGNKFNFNIFQCQNTPSVSVAASTEYADDLSANVAAGDTTVEADDGSVYAVGEYITLEGDEMPYRITGISTNTLTLNRAVRTAVLSTASNLTAYTTGLVDLAGHATVTAYPAGYINEIKVDGTGVPHVGQLVSFNTAGSPNVALDGEYCITEIREDSGDYYITLDHPLETAIANNDVVGYGTTGEFNFAFHQSSIGLVVRPLATPPEGTGARSFTANYNGLTVRVTFTYNGTGQGLLVTMDFLCGVKVLDTDLGAVMIG